MTNSSGTSVSDTEINIGELSKGSSASYTFKWTGSFSVETDPSLTVSASGTKVTGNGEQELVTKKVTKTTTVKKSPNKNPSTETFYGKVDGATENALKVEIKGQNEAAAGTSANGLTYTATITNLTEQAMPGLKLTWSGPLLKTGTLPLGATELIGTITVNSLGANASITIPFTNSSALVEGNDPSLSITATVNLLNSTSGTGEGGTTSGGTSTSTSVTTGPCTKTTNVLASIEPTQSTVNAGNTAISAGNLTLKVTAPKYTAKNAAVIYTVKVTSGKAQTVTLSTPANFSTGIWHDGNTAALTGAPTIIFTESGTKTYTYQVTPTAAGIW